MRRRGGWGVWGVGPRIVVSTTVVAFVMAVIARHYPGLLISMRRPPVARLAGTGLLAAAVAIWFVVISLVRSAYVHDRLVTNGVFAHVRNPIYSVFIFLACPGLVLFLWSWPGVALPLLAYSLYRLFIPAEEAVLRQRFGQEYDAYLRRVPGLVPAWRGRPAAPPAMKGGGAGR